MVDHWKFVDYAAKFSAVEQGAPGRFKAAVLRLYDGLYDVASQARNDMLADEKDEAKKTAALQAAEILCAFGDLLSVGNAMAESLDEPDALEVALSSLNIGIKRPQESN